MCFRNHRWLEGDATDLPFSDRQFDAITMGYGLRNVVDKDKAMREMFRVLKPGSSLVETILKLFFCVWCRDNLLCLVDLQEGKHQFSTSTRQPNHLLPPFRYDFPNDRLI